MIHGSPAVHASVSWIIGAKEVDEFEPDEGQRVTNERLDLRRLCAEVRLFGLFDRTDSRRRADLLTGGLRTERGQGKECQKTEVHRNGSYFWVSASRLQALLKSVWKSGTRVLVVCFGQAQVQVARELRQIPWAFEGWCSEEYLFQGLERP